LPETYKCLCADDNFLRLSAMAIYQSCGCDIMALSAQSILAQCSLFAPDTSDLSEQSIITFADGDSGLCSTADASSIQGSTTPSISSRQDQTSTVSLSSEATPTNIVNTGNGGTDCTVEGNNLGTFYCGGSNNGNGNTSGGLSLNNKIAIGLG
jgi:hypothetical protein